MKAIAIVSGKGGVGKTTTAINLGVALNNLGKNVVIVDANVSTPDIGLSLGAPSVPVGLQQVLSGENKITEAVYSHKSGARVVPSSLSFNDAVQLGNLKEAISGLKEMSDLILIDSAAGLGDDVVASMHAADECLIVTNAEMPALSSALKTIKASEIMGKKIIGVLVTRSRGKNEVEINDVAKFLEHQVIGVIPEDNKVKSALLQKEAVAFSHPFSKASKGYDSLARKLTGIKESQSALEGLSNLLKKCSNYLNT